MNPTSLLERYGDSAVLALGGLVIGGLFGFFAQRSRFCLRAAVIEFWHGKFGDRLSVWLLAFSAAVVGVQLLILAQWLDVSSARQLAARGSLSGAMIGGLVFGAGMIMTRGCASRLLILSANGNLRALLSGLIFAVTAQASLSGSLAPLRNTLSAWWTVEGGPSRDLLAITGAGNAGGIVFGLVWLAAALWFSVRSGRSVWKWVGGIGTGLTIAAGWGYTHLVSINSFQVVQVQGLTFSGPSAEWLMRVLSSPGPAIGFDLGLLPGVFLGSFIGAWVGKDLKLEGFANASGMPRYIAGAMLMGFGSMLAGGCAVGAGLTGGAIFALTAWLALVGMWLGAGLTDRLLDGKPAGQRITPPP
ncbi:MAG TPA: YeeE/YedE family protein [Polaromonas sp.]|uniref:YeeE/YedE family protein n=1 Tax=Polaromonas sp. TaxID=1869339 RepID=UPI002BCEF3BF|nr:YeeE/YedE family protein [Polaromonas sp.]HQS32119.1 YeeE/YedE family protein [Polaromonas sp.]